MRNGGMTLIEILVALVITMLLMSFLGTIYVQTMRVRRRTEEVASLHATAGAAFGLLRRDLTGALRLAVETYDFKYATQPSFGAGTEFHWEGPLDPEFPANGFRRIGFVTAMDGSRLSPDPVTGDERDAMRPYEYALVSWAVRGGAFFRQVGNLVFTVSANNPLPTWWDIVSYDPSAPATPAGVQIGKDIYGDAASPFTSIGPYRGAPYIKTAPLVTPYNLTLLDPSGEKAPMTVTVCVEQGEAPPPWVAAEFTPLPAMLAVEAGGTTFTLYAKACPEGKVALGLPGAGAMYFVILEPLMFSLGEEAADLVFKPSVDYVTNSDTDSSGGWTDDEAGTAVDGVWVGGVPKYVDVELTISDPDHPLGKRVFGERIGIPSGVVP